MNPLHISVDEGVDSIKVTHGDSIRFISPAVPDTTDIESRARKIPPTADR